MNFIFWGFLFIIFDCSLNIGSMILGFLPDFLGYFLIWTGLRSILGESDSFSRIRPLCLVLGGYGLVVYVMDLAGITMALSWFVLFFAILSVAGRLSVTWHFVKGLEEMEQRSGRELGASLLRERWKMFAVFQVVAIGCAFIPLLNLAGVLASLVANILFMMAVYSTGKCVNGSMS